MQARLRPRVLCVKFVIGVPDVWSWAFATTPSKPERPTASKRQESSGRATLGNGSPRLKEVQPMTRIWTTDADEFIVSDDYNDVLRRTVDAIARGVDDFLKFAFEDDTRCHIRVTAITAIGE
jgi:hypothetical protein